MLILDIGTDFGGQKIKGELACSYLRASMLQVGQWHMKKVQSRQTFGKISQPLVTIDKTDFSTRYPIIHMYTSKIYKHGLAREKKSFHPLSSQTLRASLGWLLCIMVVGM